VIKDDHDVLSRLSIEGSTNATATIGEKTAGEAKKPVPVATKGGGPTMAAKIQGGKCKKEISSETERQTTIDSHSSFITILGHLGEPGGGDSRECSGKN